MTPFLSIPICLYLMTLTLSLILRKGDKQEPQLVKALAVATFATAVLTIWAAFEHIF